jgi:WD40 repeat protein
LPNKPWRTWLSWGLWCLGVMGLGFALDAWLPPQPRWVLRGSHAPGQLSDDGKILTTGTRLNTDNGNELCISLKTWDTFAGQERGEFFRDLVGSREVSMTGVPIGRREFPDPDVQGFSTDQLVYSQDRRFCALLHRGGLALADLKSGREWRVAVKSRVVSHLSPETAALYRLLQRPIDTKGLHEKLKLKNALEYFSDAAGGKLSFLLDREAFAAELGRDALDPFEEEVCLPSVPSKMILNTALRMVLSQVGMGNAGCVMRPGFVEITTVKHVREQEAWPPIFSPHGTLVVFMEGRPKGNTLHVVECVSGQLLASLPVHADAYNVFDFTPDEELLYYFASEKGKPLFTVWNTRTRQVVRTFADIDLAVGAYILAPDGKSMLVNTDAFHPGGVDLFDLRSGQKTRCFDVSGPGKIPDNKELRHFMFSPDNRTLLKVTAGELQLWDVPDGKTRGRIKLDRLHGHWPPLFISADSRVVCALPDNPHPLTAWSLETGDRLWPPMGPTPDIDDFPPFPLALWEVPVEVHFGHVDEYTRFTPDRRFLIERKKGRIHILDPANGAANAILSPGHDAGSYGPITFTPDGHTMVTMWSFDGNRQPGLAEQWLGKWWPFPQITGCVAVADVATGRIQLRVNQRAQAFHHAALSDDGRTLMLSYLADDEKPPITCCWDVPGRPSRILVFGIPLAFAGVAVLIRCWLGRTKK